MQVLVGGGEKYQEYILKWIMQVLFDLKYSRKITDMCAFKIKFLLQNTVWLARANILTLIREAVSTQEIIPSPGRYATVIVLEYSIAEV